MIRLAAVRRAGACVLFPLLLALSDAIPIAAGAEAAEAWKILGAMDRAARSRGWHDARGRARLEIKVGGGGELVRRFRFFRRRKGPYEVATLTIFDYPAGASGTAVLRDHEGGRCDRAWIHQPALRRIRRLPPSISGGGLGGDLDPLELSLAWDLGRWRSGEAEAVWEGAETLGGARCDVVSVAPATPVCGFGRVRGWVSRREKIVKRAQLFGAGGDLLKTIDFQRVDWIDGHPTAMGVTISRPGRLGSTRLTVEEISYDVGLSPGLFQLGHLGSGVASW